MFLLERTALTTFPVFSFSFISPFFNISSTFRKSCNGSRDLEVGRCRKSGYAPPGEEKIVRLLSEASSPGGVIVALYPSYELQLFSQKYTSLNVETWFTYYLALNFMKFLIGEQ